MSDCGLDGLTFTKPSLVKPQFAADADIGVVVKRFLKTGQVPDMHDKPNIGSADSLPEDFQQLMDQNTRVRQQFELLSDEERAKYNNSCDNWLAAMAEKFEEKPQEEKPQEEKPQEEKPQKPQEKNE